jgi:DNA-directed RNA polymerase beta subunit
MVKKLNLPPEYFLCHINQTANMNSQMTAAPAAAPVPIKIIRRKKPAVAVVPEMVDSFNSENIIKQIITEENAVVAAETAVNHAESFLLDHLGNFEEEPYKIIESYFEGKHMERLVRHQIESYNHFINYQIQRTIQMFNPVVIRSENDFVADKNKYFLEIFISFTNFKLYPPQIHENNGATKTMLPQEAKLRNFTYASTMTVDLNIKYSIRNTEKMENPKIIEKTMAKINIGKLPIMLKSSICVLTQNNTIDPQHLGECPMDCGGYFIIKGSEKTVLGQERAPENRVNCFDGKNTTKWSWYAEIKSVPDYKCISPKQIEMMISSKNNGFGHGIYMTIPRVKQPIELFVVFRAFGIMSDKKICEYIIYDIDEKTEKTMVDSLQASIIDANKYMTQEDAIRHITSSVAYTPMNMDKETGIRKKREFALEILDTDIFPHCKTVQQKLFLIGYMAHKLIQTSMGLIPPNDRDSYMNKRIDLTGTLLNNLFRNYFNKLVKEMQKQIVREINTGSWRSSEDYENIINMTNIYKIMKSTTIENGINRALATGDFSIKQSNSSKVGVAQVLSRLTYVSSLSHLRRINTPIEKSGELIPPRKLHNTTWGYLCLAGDTEVLMSNTIDTKKIMNIRDGDWVNTVHRETLADESSDMNHFFSRMPDKLYEITTVSGRKIKATADHPFLAKNTDTGKYEMIKVGDLSLHDKLVIRHTVKTIPDDENTVIIREIDIVNINHRIELRRLGLLEIPIPTFKLKIFARLIGAIMADGKINLKTRDSIRFCFHNETDVYRLVEDMFELGFSVTSIRRKPGKTINQYTTTWEVTEYSAFAVVLELLGGLTGSLGQTRTIPDWIANAGLSVKREFLSTIQSCNYSAVYFSKFDNSPTIRFIVGEFSNDTVEYLNQLVKMFGELGISCCIDNSRLTHDIRFENTVDNLILYLETIHYAYSDEKRINNAPIIEFLKTIKHTRNTMSFELYKKFICDGFADNGCVCVSISEIAEIEPELVYDFTTCSDNHSFVASSFVSSNCPAESPEGQSIGIVKNLSYMAHITIPSNSNSLYEYVKPYLLSVEDTPPNQLYGKIKVFVNGVLLGVSETPMELYNEMKNKKYSGIINIYTSVVFDFKMMEIRICNDGGRLTRPVLRVRDNRALIDQNIIARLENHDLTWNDLLTNCKLPESVVEYIDPEEQNLSMIGMKSKGGYLQDKMLNIKYTHCEIHPSTIFGVLASCIPFPDHNQAPRNTYQCLSYTEEVWMANGTKTKICDVRVGDKVLSFHPENLSIWVTTVVNQFVRPNEFPMYRIRTVSGREIVATEDHRFMTDCGWATVAEIIAKMDTIKIGKYETPVSSFEYVESVMREPDMPVSCIETESENHSFIAGDRFLSANCAMSKQSMGIYAQNYDKRMDKTAYILNYPSRPLVDTRVMNILKLNRIPSGTQIHVAIMTHTGYNQEDSVLINQGSIDRGLFLTTIYHTEKDEDKNIIRDEIIRCKPDTSKTRGIKFGNYDKLNAQGFIPENELVENRDVIIAKIIPIKENRNDPTKTIKFEDQSKIFRTTEDTYIDKNFTGRNGDGYNFAKVRVRTLRKPVLGDKFASRSAQVCMFIISNHCIIILISHQFIFNCTERNRRKYYTGRRHAVYARRPTTRHYSQPARDSVTNDDCAIKRNASR